MKTVNSNFLGFGRKANGSVKKGCRANGSVGVTVVWNGCDVTVVVGEQQKNSYITVQQNYSTWLSFCFSSRFWTFCYSKARKDTHIHRVNQFYSIQTFTTVCVLSVRLIFHFAIFTLIRRQNGALQYMTGNWSEKPQSFSLSPLSHP